MGKRHWQPDRMPGRKDPRSEAAEQGCPQSPRANASEIKAGPCLAARASRGFERCREDRSRACIRRPIAGLCIRVRGEVGKAPRLLRRSSRGQPDLEKNELEITGTIPDAVQSPTSMAAVGNCAIGDLVRRVCNVRLVRWISIQHRFSSRTVGCLPYGSRQGRSGLAGRRADRPRRQAVGQLD